MRAAPTRWAKLVVFVATAMADRTEAPARLFWMHIPKCGSTLANAVCRLACPGLPAEARFTCEDKARTHHCGWKGLDGVDAGAACAGGVEYLNGFVNHAPPACDGGGPLHVPFDEASGRPLALFSEPLPPPL